jgi:hypothetical protein
MSITGFPYLSPAHTSTIHSDKTCGVSFGGLVDWERMIVNGERKRN